MISDPIIAIRKSDEFDVVDVKTHLNNFFGA
jgi:hypothetical protein